MKRILILLVALPSLLISQTAFFESFNGPFSANVSALSRDTSGNLYVGTSSMGMYKSTDGGALWKRSSDGLTNLLVTSLLIASDNTIYVGTTNEQVFSSTNSGETWSERTSLIPKGLFTATYGNVTCIAEAQQGIFYALSSANGLWFSRDRANSWMPVLFMESIQSFAANSDGDLFVRSRGALYRSNGSSTGFTKLNIGTSDALTALTVAPDNSVFVAAKNTVYRSDDDGETWRVVCQAGPVPAASPSIQRIAVSANGTIDFAFGGTIFRSIDKGTTWQQTASYDHPSTSTPAIIDEGYLLAATRDCGIFRSDDAGQSWVFANTGMAAQEVRKFITTKDESMVAVLGSRAIFSRAKNAAAWTRIKGPLSASFIFDIASDRAGTFYAATGKGVFRSPDGGAAWEAMDTVSLPYPVKSIVADTVKQCIYALTQSDGLYKMNISGTSWTLVASTDAMKYADLLKISPKGTLLFTGNQSVYRSTNGGVSWGNSLHMDYFLATDMLVPASGPISVLAGNKLYSSADDGVSFSTVSSGGFADGRAVQQLGPKKLFVGTPSGLMRSKDNGKSWTRLSSGLLNPAVNTIQWGADDFLILGTDAGVYRSVAAEPNYYFNTEGIAFGNQRIGTVRSDSVVLYNKTAYSLIITALSVADSAYSVHASSAIVPPNDSVTVTVRFSPSMLKAYNASLVFVHSYGKDSIALTGSGKAPIISFQPKEILFDSVLSGKGQTSKDIQIQNTGNDTLIVTGISSSHPSFSATQDSFRVNPGAFFQQKLFFKPETSGVFRARMIFHSNSIQLTDTLMLTGTGYLKAIAVFKMTAIDFGKVRLDTTRSLTISIGNDGNDTLKVSNVVSTNPKFSVSRNAFAVLPGGGYHIDTVMYTPTSIGADTGAIVYSSNTVKKTDMLMVFGVGTGGSFSVKQASYVNQELRAVAIARNGNIIAGTKNGMFYSRNSGTSWTAAAIADTVTNVWNIIVLPNGILLASSASQGIIRSTDNGMNWRKITSPALFPDMQSVQRSGDGTLFALAGDRQSSKSRLVSSADNGETWSDYPCGLLNTSSCGDFIVSESGVMFVTDNSSAMPRQLRSLDQGGTWLLIQTGTGAAISSIFREADNGMVFAKTISGGVIASSDSGSTWRRFYATGFATDVWAASDSLFYLLMYDQPMKRSVNRGAAWESIPTELPNAFTVKFARHYDGRLWWGNGTGLYATGEPVGMVNNIESAASRVRIGSVPINTDGIIIVPLYNNTNDTVSCLSRVLSNPRFRCSYFGGTIPPHSLITDTVIYRPASATQDSCTVTIVTTVGVTSVTMYGSGKFVTSAGRTSSASIAYALDQNYPNPFNPSTTIGYQVSTTAHVLLTVFDVLGREVTTLVNDEQGAGTHTVQWNAAGFQSGVYYYRLQAGAFTQARKFILLK